MGERSKPISQTTGRFPLGTLLLFVLLSISSSPAWGMRCGTDLVSKGDTKAEVQEACGPPACIRTPRSATILKWKAGIYWPLATDEEWVYNFGPDRFVRYVRFYQGKLVDTEAGGYGWTSESGKNACADEPARNDP